MARYLITGGAGFIGSNLAEALLERGEAVVVLDNFSTGKKENLSLSHLSSDVRANLAIVEGDITDQTACRNVMDGIDCVFHQAAIPSVPRSIELPFETNRANIEGTLNILLAARDAKVRRVVFASSSAIYGDAPGFPREESITPRPLSPYAVQKLSCEHYLRVFYELYGLETVSLRYFNVFGPRQDPESEYAAVIPRFIKALLAGQQPTVYGDGEQSRDFTYIDNVVGGNLKAMAAKDAPGKIMNLACGGQLSLNQILGMLKNIIGSTIEAQYTEPRAGDVRHSWADITLAKRILGHEIRVSVDGGLRKTVEYFKRLFQKT